MRILLHNKWKDDFFFKKKEDWVKMITFKSFCKLFLGLWWEP